MINFQSLNLVFCSQWYPGLCKKKHGQQHEGGSPSLSSHETLFGDYHPALEYSAHQQQRAQTPLLLGKSERLGVAAFQFLKRTYKNDGERLFTRASRRRGSGIKQKENRFRLDIRRNSLL